MRAIISISILLFGATAGAGTPPTAAERAELLAAHVCAECHGARGDGDKTAIPKLAAQPEDYLAAQIHAFRYRREEPAGHKPMLGMAVALDEDMIAALARYYSEQPAPRGRSGDPAQIAKGRALFREGDAKRGAAPCMLCHGERAEGIHVVPRLAGQHAVYLARQLRAIRDGTRDSPIMHETVGRLTDRQIRTLAVFLQAQ